MSRSWVRGVGCAFPALICLALPSIVLPQAANPQDTLNRAREAFLACTTNLQSGAGEGTYEVYTQVPPETELKRITKAKVKIWFDKNDYHIALDYEQDKHGGLSSRVIIRDRSGLFTSRKSKGIYPLGAEADIFEGGKSPRSAAFGFDPSRLAMFVCNLDFLMKEYGDKLSFAPATDGTLQVSFPNRSTTVRFTISPSTGYHIPKQEVINNGFTIPAQVEEGVWAKSGDLWYVRRVSETLRGSDGYAERLVLDFHTFTPNVPVSRDLFDLKALGLPDGARIIDHRRDALAQTYTYTTKRAADAAELNQLIDQAEQMMPDGPPRKSRSHTYLYLLGLAILLGVIGAILLVRRRRSRTSQSASPGRSE